MKVFSSTVPSSDNNTGEDQRWTMCLYKGGCSRLCTNSANTNWVNITMKSSLLSNVSWDTLEALNISNTDIDHCQLYNVIVSMKGYSLKIRLPSLIWQAIKF